MIVNRKPRDSRNEPLKSHLQGSSTRKTVGFGSLIE
jgi:hypothetical protein